MTTRNPTETRRRRLLSRDARWSLGLFLCGAAVSGFLYFVSPAPDARQGTSVTPGEFVPSLFLVAGWGFVEPVDYGTPELAPFLLRQQDRFDPAAIPDDLAVTTPHNWDQRHRYLYYAAALVWMLFGVSWTALKLIPVLLYASMWPIVFRIFRLAGRHKMAAACTAVFMLNPGLVDIHWTIRDFSKAPFFLGVILIIGLLLQRRVSTRRLFIYAVLAGVIAGIGVGFRRDLIMAVVPAVLAVLAAPRLNSPHPWRVKPLAAALLVVAFAVAGAPIHAAYTGLGDPHDAIMGFSRPVDTGLGIRQADYQHLPIQSDFLVHAKLQSAARTVDGEITAPQLTPDEISAQGLELSRWLVLTYPADFITRTIASARWALSGGLPAESVLIFVTVFFGMIWPMGVLFLVSAADWRRGLAMLIVCLPLFAYISLQFGYRHGFHLTFAPLWCLAFYAAHWRGYRQYKRLQGAPGKAPRVPAYLQRAGQLRGWAVIALAAVAMIGPLSVARAVQHRQVDALVAQYLEAPRAPIPVSPRAVGSEWTLFATDWDAPEPEVPFTRVDWPFREAYLAVAIAAGAEPLTGLIKYEAENNTVDFSFPFWIPPSPESDEPILYFFPIYENWHIPRGEWNRFSGVALPSEAAGRFLGLYRLTDPTQFRFWSLYRIQGDGSEFERARRLAVFNPDPQDRVVPTVTMPAWLHQVNRATGAYSGHDPVATALPAVQAGLDADAEDPALWLWYGNIREHAGEYAEAERAYRAVIERIPRHFVGYKHLEAMMTAHFPATRQIAVWHGISQEHPAVHYPFVALARAQADAERFDEALASAEQGVLLAPDREEGFRIIEETLALLDPASPAADGIWARIAEQRPESALAWRYLGSHLRTVAREPAAAVEALRKSRALDPASILVENEYAYALSEAGEYDEAIERFEAIVRGGGDRAYAHQALAGLYYVRGDIDKARYHAQRASDGGAMLTPTLRGLIE